MIKYIIFIALFLSSCSVNFKDYYETDAIEVKNQENISSFSGKNISKEDEIETSFSGEVLETSFSGVIVEEEKTTHVKIPDYVNSLYYTSNAVGYKPKMDNFYDLEKNTLINSITIDIKTVSGYTNFEFDTSTFGKIKPVSNDSIKDIKSLIKKLHEDDIYVIGRVVVFKDNLLSKNRPDLSIKWNYDKSIVWSDFSGNSYLDAGSKEVWDYAVDITNASYELGFDEINFDYVRFPSDGYISKAYFPFSDETITNYGKYGKVKIIDQFSTYITSKIREKNPDLILSADVFGLVTNVDIHSIGQNLESFLINFDYVSPMIYPSHYANGYLGYTVPDNAPYAIFQDSIKKAKSKIDDFNNNLDISTASGTTLFINSAFSPDKDIKEIKKLELEQIRPWIQGFTCTRCQGATPYTRTKFREQIRALNDFGLKSWFVWSSGSNYYREWY